MEHVDLSPTPIPNWRCAVPVLRCILAMHEAFKENSVFFFFCPFFPLMLLLLSLSSLHRSLALLSIQLWPA